MGNSSIKIVLITQSLANGGAERSCGLLSILLSNLGFRVHIVTVLDEIEFEYSGDLLNLGTLKKKKDTLLGRFQRLLVLQKYLKENDFDWIIDHRPRISTWSEFIISKFIYKPKRAIYVVHSYKIKNYFPANLFIAKKIYKCSPYIITVSNEINDAVSEEYKYSNLKTIYNSIDNRLICKLAQFEKVEGNYILAYGRINDDVKNYSLLIDSYSSSILPQQNIKLFILGNGKDLEKLQLKVKSLSLSHKVIFIPKLVNPFPYVKSALFTVLTSKYEGFPMTIIESLSLGIPVIAVDCQSGPKEIIINEKNGLLVENHNINKLSCAMNKFIEDKVLYENCKKNASESIKHLSIDIISQQWQEILSK